MIIEQLPLWIAGTNAWIVASDGAGGECVLVDAPPEPGAILDRLAALELRLVALLTTHGHVDHVGGIGSVVRSTDPRLPVHVHELDRHMLLDPVATNGSFGRYLEQTGLDVRPPEVIVDVDDGQRITGAGMTFTALHTPGHTRGSTCFLLEVEGERTVLFSGDHLFKGSIGRFDLPGGSYEQLMGSMADKVLPLDDDVAVLPGHGDRTSIGHERRTNPFLLDLQQDLGLA